MNFHIHGELAAPQMNTLRVRSRAFLLPIVTTWARSLHHSLYHFCDQIGTAWLPNQSIASSLQECNFVIHSVNIEDFRFIRERRESHNRASKPTHPNRFWSDDAFIRHISVYDDCSLIFLIERKGPLEIAYVGARTNTTQPRKRLFQCLGKTHTNDDHHGLRFLAVSNHVHTYAAILTCDTQCRGYSYGMNRNIIIGAVVLLIVIIGGYFLYTSMKPANTNGTQATSTSTANGTASSDQVQAQEVTVGTGTEAQPGDTVEVLYVGQLSDGTVFDSSAAHGNTPLKFVLGTDGMIAGFQIGVNGMKEGGERLMAIPASLGYGTQDVKDANGKVIIPANSTIVFDVKLVKVTKATSTKK